MAMAYSIEASRTSRRPNGPAPDEAMARKLAADFLADPKSLYSMRYALLCRFDCADNPCTMAYWSHAGAFGTALIDGLVSIVGDLDRNQKERKDAYDLALQIAGRVSLGLNKLAHDGMSPEDRERLEDLFNRYYPGRNGAYDRLADVYKMILWSDRGQDGFYAGG